VHTVRLDHFGVGKYPLTVGEFRRFVESTGYKTEAEHEYGALVWSLGKPDVKPDASWRKPYMKQDDDHPVVCISWNDAENYCEWLSEATGRTYGLLTEAQWEFACRAESESAYCFGNEEKDLEAYAWFGDNSASGATHPVGKKNPNAWDIHDMHGNVWEWCADSYADSYYAQLSSGTGKMARSTEKENATATSEAGEKASRPEPSASDNPRGPKSGPLRVFRGGSWYLDADYCRSAYRDGSVPSLRYSYLGFRLSRTGPLHSYPFNLSPREPEVEPPPLKPIPGLRDPLKGGWDGPTMVWLPGGEFIMGQADSRYSNEKPAHRIWVGAFSVGQYPVTFEEYDRFCEATQRDKPSAWRGGRGRRPAIFISWDDAQAYCDWLSEQTGEVYRLLTEAEWEYACRAGTETKWSCGDDESCLAEHAWYSVNSEGGTHPVGERRPNAWQLYDMHGNVWEWCADWYAEAIYKKPAADGGIVSGGVAASTGDGASGAASARSGDATVVSENPSGPATGSDRALRGGSWGGVADLCRSACRIGWPPSIRSANLGFRLSRTGPWRSHPLTLDPAQPRPGPQVEPETSLETAARLSAASGPTGRPRDAPRDVFRDRFRIIGRDGMETSIDAPELVYIPGGTFLMGDEYSGSDEKPVHPVRLDPFAIGRTPVTWGDYRRFCEATETHWPEWLEKGSRYHLDTGSDDYYRKCGITADALDLPVVGVSWDDALAFCAWLSEQTGERYALPTEGQWEYACRAGTTTRWSCGDDEKLLGHHAWYRQNAGSKLHAVGEKQPNPWGLFDMHGNIWEWCADWYLSGYDQKLSTGTEQLSSGTREASSRLGQTPSGSEQTPSENPTGPESGYLRVVRGGSWSGIADYCRSACRDRLGPSGRDDFLGFRLSRTV
ncbi:MAG: hypothetical protein EOM91_19340, partial [Sphingobacteriia bacterium]|nr:hypothetical protein [Sphingobacteriia bacterium]